MTVEERAELEQLRQQHQASEKTADGRGDDEDVLDRLKSLPEDEAVALLLQVRSEARVHQVSSGPEPGPDAHGDWVSVSISRLTLVMIVQEHCHCAEYSSALADEHRV